MTKFSTAYASTPTSERSTGRQAFGLLVSTSRWLSVGVGGWVIATALAPALVVIALGVVVGAIPDALHDGLNSSAGQWLDTTLVLAAIAYAGSLILDPIGDALGTAARARITVDVQHRLIAAVSSPVGVGHLENAEVLDRVARAEGSLTGFFPGDAPVTWAGIIAAKVSGVLGCLIIARYLWWLGLGLLIMWFAVRRLVLGAVVRQATDLRGQTTTMRRAWYLIGVGSKLRDAKEVRVFGLADFVSGRFRHEYRAAIDTGAAGLRDLHRRSALAFVLVLAGYCTALTSVALRAHDGQLSLRSLVILLPMIAVTMATGSISFDDITLTWALAGLPDVQRLEEELVTPAEPEGTVQPPAGTLRFEQVGFRYPNGHADVLDGVNLELVPGTSTAIVGVNGAGKSTLVSLLSRLRDPDAGRITVDGVDLRAVDPQQWQRNVAIMPQQPVRYPLSAYDNVALGSIEHRDDREGVYLVAETAGLNEVIAALPNGWQTVLTPELPGGTDLSGGQWQRLALARTLFATRHGARLLILDEPTAALDVRSEARFYQQFFAITEGLTTVVISHRFATVRQADLICVLDGGQITERGSHEQLLEHGGSYAQLYRVQAERFAGPRQAGQPNRTRRNP